MISLVQMRQLMHHDIFQTFLGPAGQQRIQINAACAHVAGTPARFHSMHLEAGMTHAHFLFPCLQQLFSSVGYLLLIEKFYKGAPGFLAQLAAVIKADNVSLHLIGTVLFPLSKKFAGKRLPHSHTYCPSKGSSPMLYFGSCFCCDFSCSTCCSFWRSHCSLLSKNCCTSLRLIPTGAVRKMSPVSFMRSVIFLTSLNRSFIFNPCRFSTVSRIILLFTACLPEYYVPAYG